jgi:hypothetical protein
LKVSKAGHEIRISGHQSIKVQEEIIRPALQLLHDPSNLQIDKPVKKMPKEKT